MPLARTLGCWACDFTVTYPMSMPSLTQSHMEDHAQSMCQEVRRKFVDIFTEDTKKFKFGGKPYRFWYNVGDRCFYIFNDDGSVYPMSAMHIEAGLEPTLENAQAAAKKWITEYSHGYTVEQAARYRAGRLALSAAKAGTLQPAPRGPIIPPGYDGAFCAGCGKIDEDDFMPHPTDITKEVCMSCLVKGNLG